MSNENLPVSAVHLLHRAGQVADEMCAESIAEIGITPRQFIVLQAVARNDEPSQADLVNLTGIDRSTLSDIVRRLAERNLLIRRRTKQDTRTYAVTLTRAGQAILESAQPAAASVDERIKNMLGVKVYGTLLEALGIITTPEEDIPEQKKAG